MRLSHPRRLCCAPFLCAATSCLPVSQPTCSYHLHLLGLYRPCCYQEVVPSSQQSGTSQRCCVAYYIDSSPTAQCLEQQRRAGVESCEEKTEDAANRCSLLHHAVPARTLHCFLQQRRAHHRHPTNAPLPLSALRPSGNHHFKCSKIVVSEEVCEESCTQALGFQSSYRRGQLFPASRYFPEFVAPPLSVVSTTIELANIPCSAKNST